MVKRFAELSADNKVIRVINAESKQWCESNLNGTWVETIDGGIENPRANIGDTYDSLTGKFIQPDVETVEE
jgi:hypothetical protein